jgi:AcrR family transcriptional regulator
MSPRSPSRSAGRRAARVARHAVRTAVRETASGVYRDAILAAAEAEFTDRGYAATKMVDVARRAGLSVGALYRHFENKEAIFVSLMSRAAEALLGRLHAAAAAAPDARARLAALIEVNLRFIEENRGMFLVFHKLGDSDRAACHLLVKESEEVRARIFTCFREAIADGVSRGALRDDVALDDQLAFLTGAVHGFLEAWILEAGARPLAAKADVITHLVLRALGGSS